MMFTEALKNPTKKILLKHRRDCGFNDLLNYLLCEDACTVWHRDGSVSRHFCYQPPDLEAVTDELADFQANTWRNALGFLGNGWLVETNVISHAYHYPATSQAFPELVSAIIDDERRHQYAEQPYFRSMYYLSLTWKPPAGLANQLTRFALTTDSASSEDEVLTAFNQTVNEVMGYLQRAISIRALQGNELTTFLYQAISGQDQRLALPNTGAFLNSYLARHDFVGGHQLRIGDQYIKALAIDDLPAESVSGLLSILCQYPLSYRWSSCFLPLEQATANRYLKRYSRSWSTKAIGVWGVIRESLGLPAKRDQAAQQQVASLDVAQCDNASGAIRYGFFNSTLIVMHHDLAQLNQHVAAMTQDIQQRDFQLREERYNATEAYLGSLPCHGAYNLRKILLPADVVSHLLPTHAVYAGEPQCPCPYYGKDLPPLLVTSTSGQRPFCFNLHVSDVGHTLILGPTGMGKTTLVGLMMASHRKYAGSRIVVFDKDYSNRCVIQALGGNYYDVAKGEVQFSPLAGISSTDNYRCDQVVQWLSACCELQGIVMTPAYTRALQEAVRRLATADPAHHTLDYLTLQEPGLREAIAVLTHGSYRDILAGTECLGHQADVLGFEMGALVQSGKSAMPILLAMLQQLEALFRDGRPTLLILEEAWLYLQHPLLQRRLADWFKTLRKRNVAVIFISQDIHDITQSEIATVIQSSCPTRIYLPNVSASHMQEAYESFGLNAAQIQLIQAATPKRDYYYQSPLGQRLFQLDLGELAQAFLCVSSKADQDQFNQIFNQQDPQWVLQWLTYKAQSRWCDFINTHYLGNLA